MTGDGSINSPWQTITKGQSMLVPGDTLLVRGGRYYESVTLTKQGINGNLITIKAYPGEIPILDGTKTVAVWEQCNSNDSFLTVEGVINPNYSNIYKAKIPVSSLPTLPDKYIVLENGEHLRIARNPDQKLGYGEDITLFYPVPTDAYGETKFLFDNGLKRPPTQPKNYWATSGTRIHIHQHKMNNWVVSRNIISNSDNKIYFDTELTQPISYGSVPDSYSILNHPHVLDTAGEFAHTIIPEIIEGKKYFTFYVWPKVKNLNEMTPTQVIAYLSSKIRIPSPGHGFYASDKNYITIDGFQIIGYSWNGIKFINQTTRINGITIKNCTITDCGSSGISLYAANNSIIEDCSINRVNEHGIDLPNSLDITIQRCNVGYAEKGQIWVANSKNLRLLHNIVGPMTGTHGNGIAIYGGCSRTLVAYNYFKGCGLNVNDAVDLVTFANVSEWGLATRSTALGYHIHLHNIFMRDLGLLNGTTAPYPQYYSINNIAGGITGGVTHTLVDESYNVWTVYNSGMSSIYGWSLSQGSIDAREIPISNIFSLANEGSERYIPLNTDSPQVSAGIDIMPILITTGVVDPKNDNNSWFPGFDFTKDKAGNPWKSTPSMGAYEYTGTSTESSTKYTLNVQTRNCSVTKTPDKTSYDSGEEVLLTAKPLTRFRFSEWSITANEQTTTYYANPITITMDGNKIVTAICASNPTEGQVFHAPLYDGTGTIVTDANNLYTGNLIGGPLWGTGWRDEDWLGFNQSTQAITIPTMGMLPQAGTIAVWVEPKDFSGMKFIFGHVLNNANRLSLYTVAGSLAVGLGSNATLKTNITPLSLNQPVHLALSWEETAYTVYVNGVQKAAGTFGGLTALNTFIDIGNYGDPAFRSLGFAGKIDDIRTYNRALAAEEIDALYLTQDVRQGKELQFTVNAVNTQGIPIVYQASAMPAGASFDAATQSVTWTPWHNQLGLFSFRFTSTGQPEKVVNVEVHPSSMTSWYSSGQEQLTKVR